MMIKNTRNSTLGVLIVCISTLLFGCGKEPQRAVSSHVEDTPAEQKYFTSEPSEVVETHMLGSALLRSAEAPFACDALTVEDVEKVMDAETVTFDVTEKRRANGAAVESSCLFAYGEDKNPDSIRLKAKFISLDVYTDVSVRAAGWGPLHGQWMRRSEENGKRFKLMDDVWAAWVDSDHPPDPALLVWKGEVMFEIAYFPPSSSVGTKEGNAKIEQLARILVAGLAGE